MSQDTKKKIISAGVTFVGAFVAFVVPSLVDPSWDFTSRAAILSLIVAGVRAGVKVVWEKWGPVL